MQLFVNVAFFGVIEKKTNKQNEKKKKRQCTLFDYPRLGAHCMHVGCLGLGFRVSDQKKGGTTLGSFESGR